MIFLISSLFFSCDRWHVTIPLVSNHNPCIESLSSLFSVGATTGKPDFRNEGFELAFRLFGMQPNIDPKPQAIDCLMWTDFTEPELSVMESANEGLNFRRRISILFRETSPTMETPELLASYSLWLYLLPKFLSIYSLYFFEEKLFFDTSARMRNRYNSRS